MLARKAKRRRRLPGSWAVGHSRPRLGTTRAGLGSFDSAGLDPTWLQRTSYLDEGVARSAGAAARRSGLNT